MVRLDQTWDVHRWVLRERGIIVTGPDPKTLIDPVPPERLRQAMRTALNGWAAQVEPGWLGARGGQSYVVLTICRILYTLETGAVASKPTAARWAREHLDARWTPLVERAWEGRHTPGAPAAEEEIAETLALVRWAMDREGLPKRAE